MKNKIAISTIVLFLATFPVYSFGSSATGASQSPSFGTSSRLAQSSDFVGGLDATITVGQSTTTMDDVAAASDESGLGQTASAIGSGVGNIAWYWWVLGIIVLAIIAYYIYNYYSNNSRRRI